MKKISGLFSAFIILVSSQPSSSQGVKKIPIGKSGCSLYSYCEMKFDISKSPDSSMVYAAECTKEDITYGIICVQLVNPPENLQMAEDLLISYLDFLKGNFGITKSAGYGKGHILNKNENTRGILDYWEDGEKNKWKVKAWTDGKFIGVMYVYSLKDIPESKVTIYLDGFRVPNGQ